MQTLGDNYLTAYRNLKLTRDAEGVLVVQFHSNGRTSHIYSRGPYGGGRCLPTGFSQDRANKIVITSRGREGTSPMIGVDWSSFSNVSDPGVWSQTHDEGVQVLENIANIRVPGPLQPSRDVPISILSTRSWPTSLWRARARRSRTSATSPRVLCPVMASSPRGAIARERDGQRLSCSIHNPSRRVLRMNGGWLLRSFRTVRLSPGHASWPRFT